MRNADFFLGAILVLGIQSEIIPDGYTYLETEWNSFYYKTYQKLDYLQAVETCSKDGAKLPYPESGKGMIHLCSEIVSLI